MCMTQKQIDNRGEKRAALVAQIKELQAKVDAIDDEMKAECVALGVDKLTGKEWKVTYKEQISRKFQSAKFAADHKDLYEAYRLPVASRPFNFTPLTEKEKKEAATAAMLAAAATA